MACEPHGRYCLYCNVIFLRTPQGFPLKPPSGCCSAAQWTGLGKTQCATTYEHNSEAFINQVVRSSSALMNTHPSQTRKVCIHACMRVHADRQTDRHSHSHAHMRTPQTDRESHTRKHTHTHTHTHTHRHTCVCVYTHSHGHTRTHYARNHSSSGFPLVAR
jgi:hypothetical protein